MTDPTNNQKASQHTSAGTRSSAPTGCVTVDEERRSTASRVALQYRPTAIGRLKRAGFTQTEAEQWTSLEINAFWTKDDLVPTACAFRDAGFDLIRGRDWARMNITVAEARDYEAAGWTPHDVWALQLTLHRVRHPEQRGCPFDFECEDDAPGWVATGIPPHLVLLYIHAGHAPTIATAIDKKRREGNKDIVPALLVMGALKNPHATRKTTLGPNVVIACADPHGRHP